MNDEMKAIAMRCIADCVREASVQSANTDAAKLLAVAEAVAAALVAGAAKLNAAT